MLTWALYTKSKVVLHIKSKDRIHWLVTFPMMSSSFFDFHHKVPSLNVPYWAKNMKSFLILSSLANIKQRLLPGRTINYKTNKQTERIFFTLEQIWSWKNYFYKRYCWHHKSLGTEPKRKIHHVTSQMGLYPAFFLTNQL